MSSEQYTRDLRVDLTEADFLCSVGVLVRAMRAADQHGCAVHLVAPGRSITGRVLQICGVPFSAPCPTPSLTSPRLRAKQTAP